MENDETHPEPPPGVGLGTDHGPVHPGHRHLGRPADQPGRRHRRDHYGRQDQRQMWQERQMEL